MLPHEKPNMKKKMTLLVEVSKVHNAMVTVDFFHIYFIYFHIYFHTYFIYFSFVGVMQERCIYITPTPQSPTSYTYEYNLLSLFGTTHMSTC